MKEFELILDTLEHKQLILDCGLVMTKWLIKEGRDEEALAFLKRLIVHDNSKLSKGEINLFLQIEDSEKGLKDAYTKMSEQTKKAIELHWKNNRHHPECFADYHEMKELDIIEMVCDWFSRSLQYKTDFLEFVKIRQDNRFHFEYEFFKKVWYFCLIINNEYKTASNNNK